MAWNVYPKEINGHSYYYAQRSWREKTATKKDGKSKGEAKSKVRTETVYLGSAEAIVNRLKKTRKPVEVKHRDFGFVAALYQTAVEIGLVDLLRTHIPGQRYGAPRWLYFMLPIINRLQQATSKEQMGKWAQGTVLPDLLDFDPKRLNSKSFWYATDDVISEKELRERRKESSELDDELFVGLEDGAFARIEEELMAGLREKYGLCAGALLYDTTNFFTYIEAPVRAKLANTGHNKDAHHHLRQIGLAMCADKNWGIPLFYRMYRGNVHDSKCFTEIIDELMKAVKAGFDNVDELVLVLDKGNNSKKNFAKLKGKIRWVGSLVPSHHEDLIARPLADYEGTWADCRYHRLARNVMGIECALVLTYNDRLARKQKHSLRNGIEKLERQIREKWATYKKTPSKVPAGVETLRKQSRYKDYVSIACQDGQPLFQRSAEIAEKIAKREKRFGKNLLFSSDLEAEAPWIITQYHAKDRIEDNFKILKSPDLIRWRPCRHWTDTKIRAFGFCCMMALVLIRVMERKTAQAGLPMSPALIKEELTDLKEVVMVYGDTTAETQITQSSSVQQRLWNLFDLGFVENHLTRHEPISYH